MSDFPGYETTLTHDIVNLVRVWTSPTGQSPHIIKLAFENL